MSAEGNIIARQQALGRDRTIVDQIDLLRASEFVSDVLSGASNYTSGFALLAMVLSNVARIRPLNIHFQNRETSAMTVVYRDGSITGAIVAGPYIINPTQDRTIKKEDLEGRYFLSGIYPVVISGTFSAGIVNNIGFIIEPDDYFV